MNFSENQKSEIFCPQCGGKNFLDSPNVKFCRFCGLTLVESRDAVRGLTEIKQKGFRYSTWGYCLLQGLFIVMFMLFIPKFPGWVSVIFMSLFALSNGFFIAGQFAVEKPDRYAEKDKAKSLEAKTNYLPKAETISEIPSVVENTTRDLSGKIFSGKNRTAKLI